MRDPDGPAVAEAIAELREAALGCVACQLQADRTQVVFGCGNPATPMVLVGQSPGEQEDQSGEPFVGRAGQLLTECLARCTIQRRHVWITNIVKCRPWTRTERGKGRNRDPEEDEIQACRQWIEAELALIRPKVIVCIGKPSAELVLGRPIPISQVRGRWFVDHRFRPAWVMPVLHPAYIVRKQGQADYEPLCQQLADDLETARQKARQLLKEPVQPTAAELANAEPTAPDPLDEADQPSLFDA
ncbi:MAG: uracil-DNA glycosylase [Fimbriimonadaceae bacterium]|nr:uracil-DNA glycosylase [Fimbriimonadaceae bacterium]